MQHPLIGKVLADDFEVVSFLGKGGMGMVFLGQQLSLNRKVVIKLLPTLDLSSEEAYRFETEIAAMATLCHPNIVTIYNRGKFGDPPTLYYVMEFLEGGSLKEYIQEFERMPVSIAIRLIRQVAEGLAYAHEQGCIHRDIKPDNLLFNKNHRILKIADFGIAKQTAGSSNITHSQNMVGTFLYAAPEQMKWFAQDEDIITTIDGRADQYALGMVLYETLSGRLPYQARNFFEMMKVINQPPTPLAAAMGHPISQSVEWLVETMIAKERDNRFPTDEALLEAMSNVEMEQAATSATRIFAIKTEEISPSASSSGAVLNPSPTIHVPPPMFHAAQTTPQKSTDLPRNTDKSFIQNLGTLDCSPQDLIAKEKKALYLKYGIRGGIATVILFFILLVWIFSIPKELVVRYTVSYDIIPTENCPKLQVFMRNKHNERTFALPQSIPENEYQLVVVSPGYLCNESGREFRLEKDLTPELELNLHLTAMSRKVSSQIIDTNASQAVMPFFFQIGNLEVTPEQEWRPGHYPLMARFPRHHDIQGTVEISIGTETFQYHAALRPLRECKITLLNLTYPYATDVKLSILVDNKALEEERYSYEKREQIFLRIFIPEDSQKILIKRGIYAEEVSAKEIADIYTFSQIDIPLLIAHLDKCSTHQKQFLEMLEFLWKTEQKRLLSLSFVDKKQLADWLISKTNAEHFENMQHPILLVRQLIIPEEAKERQDVLLWAPDDPNISQQELWERGQAILRKYPNGSYRNYVKKIVDATKIQLDYDAMLKEYEEECRASVVDCVLSLSEKRKMENMRKKIKPEDVAKIHERMEKYVKEEKRCGRSFKELIQ